MIYVISIIFVLSVLVFFHELGHFMLAKLFGVRVERFSIGFPPRLFGVQLGETDYCISAIPFGGYVKMAGVIDESMDTNELKGEPYEFASKKGWQKVLILIGGVTMNMILAWAIISGLMHIEGEPIIPYTTVGYVAETGVMEQAGIKVGDKILSINGQPVHTWNDIRDQYIGNLGNRMVFKIDRDGKTDDIIVKKSALEEKNSDQLDIFPLIPAKVGEVLPDSPAGQAGLQRGETILSINGQQVKSWEAMTNIVRDNPNKSLEFTIQKDGETLTKTITPDVASEISENGTDHKIGKIGIGVYYEKNKLPVGAAMVQGFDKTVFITKMSVKGLWWIVSGKKSAKRMLGGPIMITKLAGEFAKSGFASLLELVANLSIMLAFINILPIPALDGGHIAIVAIEAIRRKPLSTQTKLKIQQVGMALLFVLIIFVMYNDIMRLFHS
ncbi:MAG: RIP metalloprotease RseP [Calditrichia bacterium]